MQLKDNIKFTIDKQMSIGGEDCKNILIKGDNKAILPELVPVYRGKIKCIYIDPPYNNGDSYHYYNDNTTTSAWLKDMRSVLSWLKMLLKKDGSIWISIDDKEMAYLKVEADIIFGRENFATRPCLLQSGRQGSHHHGRPRGAGSPEPEDPAGRQTPH